MALTLRTARAVRLYERLLKTKPGDVARWRALSRRINSFLDECTDRETEQYYQAIIAVRAKREAARTAERARLETLEPSTDAGTPGEEVIEWP